LAITPVKLNLLPSLQLANKIQYYEYFL